MADTGILIVSHSKNLAQGLFDLISQVAADVAISYVGGLDDGSLYGCCPSSGWGRLT